MADMVFGSHDNSTLFGATVRYICKEETLQLHPVNSKITIITIIIIVVDIIIIIINLIIVCSSHHSSLAWELKHAYTNSYLAYPHCTLFIRAFFSLFISLVICCIPSVYFIYWFILQTHLYTSTKQNMQRHLDLKSHTADIKTLVKIL